MKHLIYIQKILEYYDIPQVFLGNDNVSTLYICMLYDDEDVPRYVAVQASRERVAEYLNKEIDLRTVFTSPEIETYYDLTPEEDHFKVQPLGVDSLPEEMLPGEGFFNNDNDDELSIIEETSKYNHPIFRLGFVNPQNSHTIDAPTLSAALSDFQKLTTSCYVKIDGRRDDRDHNLYVSVFQAASFDVQFYADSDLDMFRYSRIERTFNKLDELFRTTDPQRLKTILGELKGHTVSNYKDLVKLLLDNRLSMKYQWLSNSGGESKLVKHRIHLDSLENVYDVLSESSELENELVIFVGRFTKVDTTNNKWTIVSDEDNKSYSGDSLSNLSGITVETIRYRITCKENIVVNNVSAKEKFVYHLEHYESINE